MSLKALVQSLLESFFHRSLETPISTRTCRTPSANPHQLMSTLVEDISNSYNHNLRIPRFPDLICKIFLITFKLSQFDFSNTLFARALNKTV